jgi:hypothetical protein
MNRYSDARVVTSTHETMQMDMATFVDGIVAAMQALCLGFVAWGRCFRSAKDCVREASLIMGKPTVQ